MNMQNILFVLLGAIILVWISLGTWRSAGNDLMRKVEQSYRDHYQKHASDSGEALPLVRWDFAQDTLVAVPPEDVQEIDGTGGLRAFGVSVTEQPLSFSTTGKLILARIPGAVFHGSFAAALLLIGFFALRIR